MTNENIQKKTCIKLSKNRVIHYPVLELFSISLKVLENYLLRDYFLIFIYESKNLKTGSNYDFGFCLSKLRLLIKISQRNWLFVTNSEFIIPMSLEPNVVHLWYFKTYIIWSKRIHSLKYLRSTTLDIRFRKVEFVAKTHSLTIIFCFKKSFFCRRMRL